VGSLDVDFGWVRTDSVEEVMLNHDVELKVKYIAITKKYFVTFNKSILLYIYS